MPGSNRNLNTYISKSPLMGRESEKRNPNYWAQNIWSCLYGLHKFPWPKYLFNQLNGLISSPISGANNEIQKAGEALCVLGPVHWWFTWYGGNIYHYIYTPFTIPPLLYPLYSPLLRRLLSVHLSFLTIAFNARPFPAMSSGAPTRHSQSIGDAYSISIY